MRRASLLSVILLSSCASDPADPNEPNRLETPRTTLQYEESTGRIDIRDRDGHWILENATAWVLLEATSVEERGRLVAIDASSRTRNVVRREVTDALGSAEQLEIRASSAQSDVDLTWTISAYPAGFYTFQLEVENRSVGPVRLAKAVTVGLGVEEAAGLFLGAKPSTHRVLENGSHVYLDHVADVRPGDAPLVEALNVALEGEFVGSSVSNWNHTILDLDSGASWVAGSLTFESAVPVFSLRGDLVGPRAPDGREGFSVFAAEAAYLPEMKPIPSGESFASERTYVHPSEDGPLVGVEHYADAVKKQLGIRLWTERGEGRRVPNGWNSWSGSGGTGGYGTGIDEATMIENLDVMATEFRDFGMDYFQIDDGYEPAYGDWTWREDRFPHGPRWLSDEIRKRGLKPGLWLAPFAPSPRSTLVSEHPDWMAERASSLGSVFGSGDYEILDLTNPEVKAWLRALFTRFREDWNFDWLKVDFAYFALLGSGLFDPTQTREEAYRGAMRIIREAVGDDTFIMTVAVMGVHYGLADSDRVTLDSMPVWDSIPGATSALAQQGLKPTVRTAARRYYLHNRIWINHPDLIFFRSNSLDETWPRLTLDEAQAFCSFVGLSGGIVKLGDRLVDLEAEHINTVRKLLPTYGEHARPLDLFEREYPEKWHLRIERGLDGYDEAYDLVGLFHWGTNTDLSASPYRAVPDSDEPLSFSLDLDMLGIAPGRYLAYEFWTGEMLGQITDRLVYDVPPHSARVIAIRPELDRPQFLGWNRQLTMGGSVLREASWAAAANTLSLESEVAAPSAKAPFTYEVAIHVPSGFELVSAQSETLPDLNASRDGSILRLSFVPASTHVARIVLQFRRID